MNQKKKSTRIGIDHRKSISFGPGRNEQFGVTKRIRMANKANLNEVITVVLYCKRRLVEKDWTNKQEKQERSFDTVWQPNRCVTKVTMKCTKTNGAKKSVFSLFDFKKEFGKA
jgi:hypothetical protein